MTAPHSTRAAALGLAVMTVGALAVAAGTASTGAAVATSPASAHVGGCYTQTHIQWNNQLDRDITFSVGGTRNELWDGSARPDAAAPQGIANYTLKAGQSFNERLDVNCYGGVPFFGLSVADSHGDLTNFTVQGADGLPGANWRMDWGTTSKRFTFKDAAGGTHSGRVEVTSTGDDASAFTFKPAN
ncbi:MAG: hypothetical protein WBZ04_01410 [Candidatus Nanopelagicales bacterium]